MTDTSTRTSLPSERPLRLWPGVVLVALQWLVKLGLPVVAPGAAVFATLGGVVLGLAVVVWWVFFSRARRLERWGAVPLIIVAIAATPLVLDESIRTAGMGIAFYLLVIPGVTLALVVGALLSRRFPTGRRRATLAAAILAACGFWALVRTAGIEGDGSQDLAWRWSATAEERLLARAETERLSGSPAPATGAVEWPGFRGPRRDAAVPGVRLATDWSASPPAEVWRHPIGPGWSSFAVLGERLYTQEQRGEEEIVTCYDRETGAPVWRHGDAVRFWESHAGAGPRATPSLHEGRVYTFGATGLLNALDAADGSVVWSRDVAADTAAQIPHWGFTSSPLVVDDLVVVDAGTLVAYDLATGDLRWRGPTSPVSYSSPHLVTFDGARQIVLLAGRGAVSVAPADGQVLWEHAWSGSSIVQPAVTADGDLLISATGASAGRGIRRLTVARGTGGWAARELWTSTGLKPYFSDFVAHEGHAYGFDGAILSCISLADGERCWKGGRYGHGQLVLLPDQDLLLVVTERGELALVDARPDGFAELARSPAIEGKSWSHPVLVDDLLLLRNAREMAAFRLAGAGS